jgi:diguanylate cyclase (GGDEF)-like protein
VVLPPAVLLQRSLTYLQMRAAARTDAKTGLLNAAAWQEEADREIVRYNRHQHPLAVLMIDLDNFKAFNDTYGHLAGDQALAAVASSLTSTLRSYDQLGRFGGEEFSVVLPNADHTEAQRVAERLRRAVAQLVISGVEQQPRLTVSIGAAIAGTHGAALIDLLAAADHALYQAKAAGRDRVVFAPGVPTLSKPPGFPQTRRPAAET